MGKNMRIKNRRQSVWLWISLAIAGLAVLFVAVISLWYFGSLAPVDKSDTTKRQFSVEMGASTEQIANDLRAQGLIRNANVFAIYAKLHNKKIEAGTHLLAPSESTQEIAEKLAAAETDQIAVTIPPGLTLDELRKVFQSYGFTDEQITAAYEKNYDSTVLADRPAGADLEGYIFPETYNINLGDGPDVVIQKSLDELDKRLQNGNLIAKFKQNGLTTYGAITLASIVQKEVSDAETQRKVAGVFYNRLAAETWLGSDVTYMYAAEKSGAVASPNLDSPYNTRLYKGLPPGPIANMNFSALSAVADPEMSDYVYFVAGDDGATHFSLTEDEHLQNVAKYCTTLCQ